VQPGLTQLATVGKSASAYNLAVSYQKRYALTGDYPDAGVAYDRVMLSRGGLMAALEVSVELVGSDLQFSWLCPEWVQWPDIDDEVAMVVYFPESGMVVYELNGPRRRALGAVLAIPPDLVDKRMEVYLFFVAESGKGVSDSVYVGRLGG